MMLFRKAVLFIHGFSASYYENEYFINTLQRYPELDVYTFTLPGHEPPIMRKVKYESWIAKSEEELKKLLDDYHTIYLVGHSMGGVIASYLASKYKSRIKKLVLIAPAFEYGSFHQNKKDIQDFFERENRKGVVGYDTLFSKILTVPITRIIEFTKLVRRYKHCIHEVQCPVLLLQGNIDNVVPFSSSVYAYDALMGQKYFTVLRDVRHQVFISEKKELITNYIYTFLKSERKFEKQKKDIL